MSDLSISPEDVTSALRSMLEGYQPATTAEQVGRVVSTSDGIATIVGLPGTLANELLDFGDGVMGMAMNLDEGEIGAAVFSAADKVEEGQTVRRTERVLRTNSRVPRCASRAATARVIAGGDIVRSRAAAAKPPSSATFTKTWIECRRSS